MGKKLEVRGSKPEEMNLHKRSTPGPVHHVNDQSSNETEKLHLNPPGSGPGQASGGDVELRG